MSNTVRVWDLPTRIFHWALVACIIGLVITSQIGGNAMPWHFRFGYCVLGLLLFRLVWGLIGGRWSRFGSFLYSPRSVINYLKGAGRPEHSVGHNPLGAGSVLAMLVFLLAQVATGLCSDDEIAAAGPLTKFVSNATVSLATGYHKNIGSMILLALVILHLAAIAFYYLKKRENLVAPMIHGDKELPQALEGSRDDKGSRFVALVVLGLCAAGVASVLKLAG